MIIVTGPVADHYVRSMVKPGCFWFKDAFAAGYKGSPYLGNGIGLSEWIVNNIDHQSLIVLHPDSPVGPIGNPGIYYDFSGNSVLFGTFASDDDAILFKMRWEGAR